MRVTFNTPEICLNGLAHCQLPIFGDIDKLAIASDKEVEPICFKLLHNKRMFRGALCCKIGESFSHFGQGNFVIPADRTQDMCFGQTNERK